MATTNNYRNAPTGEVLLAASRQVWLAGLGAAVVTREWAQNQAGPLFRTLVKQGTAVESRTFRKVGDRFENSITLANDLWRTARGTMAQSVKQATETATTLVRETLPKRLPTIFRAPAPKRRAARATKVVKARAATAKKRAKRVAKRATRRT